MKFTNEEVFEALKGKSRGKAAGPDDISYEQLISHPHTTVPLLTWLFNVCLEKGEIPNTWRRSFLIPIFKGKGDARNPDDYRGVALTSCVYKVLTTLVTARILAKVYHVLPPEQYGLMPDRSTEDALRVVIDYVKARQPKMTYAVFIDFRKCFDSIPRDRLMETIKGYRLSKNMTSLLRDILRPNFIRVKNGTALIDTEIRQTRGLAQGNPASPMLFVLYAASLADTLRRTGAVFAFFADDLVILAKDLPRLQSYLRQTDEWSRSNGLQISTSKTKIMRFSRGGSYSKTDRQVKLRHSKIELVNNFNYLGVTLTPKLSFTQHLEIKKAKAAAATILIGNMKDLEIKQAMKIFKIKVAPIATYCIRIIAEDLSTNNLKQLDQIKTQFVKKVLGLPENTSSTLSLHLASEKRFAEELASKGTKFREEVLREYREICEEKHWKFFLENFMASPAYQSERWKNSHQPNRGLICRATWHGYHHLMCTRPNCFDRSECTCKFCNRTNIERYHIQTCTVIRKRTLKETVEAITSFRR